MFEHDRGMEMGGSVKANRCVLSAGYMPAWSRKLRRSCISRGGQKCRCGSTVDAVL